MKKYEYLIGKKIHINSMMGEPQYSGKEGVVEFVDDMGQIFGTWGGLAIQKEHDDFYIVEE